MFTYIQLRTIIKLPVNPNNGGRYKTWTLDSGLDYGLDYRLDYGLDLGLDFGPDSIMYELSLCFRTFQAFPPFSF